MEVLGLATLPLAFGAFCAAALSMDRHHRQVTGRTCPGALRGPLRLAAALGFSAAFMTAFAGGGVGLVTGVLAAGTAAAAVVGVLNLRPQLLRVLLPKPAGRPTLL